VYFYTGRRAQGEDKEAKTIKFQLFSQAVNFSNHKLVYIQYWIAFCEMNWEHEPTTTGQRIAKKRIKKPKAKNPKNFPRTTGKKNI